MAFPGACPGRKRCGFGVGGRRCRASKLRLEGEVAFALARGKTWLEWRDWQGAERLGMWVRPHWGDPASGQ